ncbi:HupE/UreJ family protein [Sediminitomix flava]|uniref:HupE/UreJ protein n=1 Tax=Sediminitomix flava TaxID=379075 RepID=A0A315ZEA0_SEDFL|nr:HupE/UreJ family protein [Sediminitomix flava]PWJ43662.1 HupE/UreJ protein [Sediminitomix flava]
MEEISIYLKLGLEHITDPNGYDHILFIVTLGAIYSLVDWKKVLWLVTAFTLGHSITLVLAVLDVVDVNASLIEFLIPLTIALTAFSNIFYNKNSKNRIYENRNSKTANKDILRYTSALLFGLIHGLGFSNYLSSLLGKEAEIVLPLLSFNIGLELGQIAIVLVLLLVSTFVVEFLRARQRDWNLWISGGAFTLACQMMIERW